MRRVRMRVSAASDGARAACRHGDMGPWEEALRRIQAAAAADMETSVDGKSVRGLWGESNAAGGQKWETGEDGSQSGR